MYMYTNVSSYKHVLYCMCACMCKVLHQWSRCLGLKVYFSTPLLSSSAKTITTCCLPPYCDCLFVGTLGGITYPMDTEFDGMSPEVLSWSRARA